MSSRPETPPTRRSSRTVELPAEDLGLFIACATRYALGRQSYVTGDVAARVKDNWRRLTPRWRLVIQRDLERELDPNAPPLPDRAVWEKLHTWIQTTETTRGARAGAKRGE